MPDVDGSLGSSHNVDITDTSALPGVPGIPDLRVLTRSPKAVRGHQTFSAPGDVSHGRAWYFIDALELGRAGLIRVSDLKRQVLYRLS
jgi:hypothetical protein